MEGGAGQKPRRNNVPKKLTLFWQTSLRRVWIPGRTKRGLPSHYLPQQGGKDHTHKTPTSATPPSTLSAPSRRGAESEIFDFRGQHLKHAPLDFPRNKDRPGSSAPCRAGRDSRSQSQPGPRCPWGRSGTPGAEGRLADTTSPAVSFGEGNRTRAHQKTGRQRGWLVFWLLPSPLGLWPSRPPTKAPSANLEPEGWTPASSLRLFASPPLCLRAGSLAGSAIKPRVIKMGKFREKRDLRMECSNTMTWRAD